MANREIKRFLTRVNSSNLLKTRGLIIFLASMLIRANYKPPIMSSKAIALFTLLLFAFNITSFTQLANYTPQGSKSNISGEKIIITINKQSDQINRSPLAPLSLPDILTNFVSLGVNTVKTIISHQQEKYTAIYASNTSDNGLIYIPDPSRPKAAALNIHSIEVRRMTDDATIATEIVIKPEVEPQSGLFRLKVSELNMPFTKAKIKKAGHQGKTIDVSISIKIDAMWKESGNKSGVVDSNDYTIKTATLGDYNILVPGIKPGKSVVLTQNYFSGWYQLIPRDAMKFATEESGWKTGWYTVTINVKEANPFALSSKQLSDFLNPTSSDISTFLKSFIPANAK